MPSERLPFPNPELHKVDGIACYDLHLPPALKMNHHPHKNAHLCLVLKGGFTESQQADRRWCGDGMLRISKPNQVHNLEFGPTPTRCLIFDLQTPYFNRYNPLWQPLTAHTFLNQAIFPALSYRLYTEIRRTDADSSVRIELLLREILSRAAIRQTDAAQPLWLTAVYDMLHKKYREPVQVATISERVGIHRVHLNRTFHRYFGCTVSRYVKLLRLEFARQALSTTTLPIAAVALDAGFSDQSHLTRLFKQQFGLPPAAYRNQSSFSDA